MHLTYTTMLWSHWNMWDWLAKNPLKSKVDYFYQVDDLEIITNGCYLCQWVVQRNEYLFCEDCPVYWPDMMLPGSRMCLRSYYGLWTKSNQKTYALKVRDIIYTHRR